MIKVIAFDFGGVLYTWNTRKFVRDLAKELKVPMIKIILKRKEIIAILENFERGDISEKEFWDNCLSLFGFSCDAITLKKIHDISVNHFQPIKENIELVKILKRNFKVGLLSNQVDWIDELESKYYFRELFDLVVISKEVGCIKPEKKIFEIFVNKAKVNPEEILFIDDQKNFKKAAEKFGIKSILYKTPEKLKKELSNLGIKPIS